jgi:hypothetical protein
VADDKFNAPEVITFTVAGPGQNFIVVDTWSNTNNTFGTFNLVVQLDGS